MRKLRKDAGISKGEGPKQNHVFRNFEGINTQAKRQAIGKGQFSWIENVMPLGHGNGIILKQRSGVLASYPSGDCYYQESFNIDGLNYIFGATDDGHAYQVLLDSPYTVTAIGSVFHFGSQDVAVEE